MVADVASGGVAFSEKKSRPAWGPDGTKGKIA
jgi:hypothetical protein